MKKDINLGKKLYIKNKTLWKTIEYSDFNIFSENTPRYNEFVVENGEIIPLNEIESNKPNTIKISNKICNNSDFLQIYENFNNNKYEVDIIKYLESFRNLRLIKFSDGREKNEIAKKLKSLADNKRNLLPIVYELAKDEYDALIMDQSLKWKKRVFPEKICKSNEDNKEYPKQSSVRTPQLEIKRKTDVDLSLGRKTYIIGDASNNFGDIIVEYKYKRRKDEIKNEDPSTVSAITTEELNENR